MLEEFIGNLLGNEQVVYFVVSYGGINCRVYEKYKMKVLEILGIFEGGYLECMELCLSKWNGIIQLVKCKGNVVENYLEFVRECRRL